MPVLIGYTAIVKAASSRSTGGGPAGAGVIRNPNDPIYYADVILDGIVPGSRYWMAEAGNPNRVLATGVASSNPYTVTGVPAYGNPYQIELRVRNASGHPYYKPLNTYFYHSSLGVRVFVQQELDE